MGGVKKLVAATALSVALLAGATAAPAAEIGANDDSPKYDQDGGAALFTQMRGVGLSQIVIPVRFKPSDAMTIQDKPLLDRTIPAALAAGLDVVLAVYPYPTREVEAGLSSASLFGSYVGAVASVYPEVKEFVIGNEPNQPAFWRPQFSGRGRILSAPAFGQYLATAYDALKAVDPDITVVGVGLSPRGNDRPNAKSNVSTSPVRFLRALGTWYRASGREKPLMDAFSFHPYPNSATDPLDRGYVWPNAGFANLDRIKQALWDAFNGTAQPTTLEGLKLHLDEVGWQVGTSGLAGYVGVENVAVTDEITQAGIYAELVRRASCDPDVAQLSFFGFRDDGLRTGFQAALQRADGSSRPAVEAVRQAIADVEANGCGTAQEAWQPRAEVVDPEVALNGTDGASLALRVRAGEDANARICLGSRPLPRGVGTGTWEVRSAGCRAMALTGLKPMDITLGVAGTARTRIEVTTVLAATSNESRKTVVHVTASTE
jgi:hypothetical protein